MLSKLNHLKAFQQEGFLQPMDTLRDKIQLEDIWKSIKAPWKLWI
jgi:glucose-1-phosphate cytidylyltransferase